MSSDEAHLRDAAVYADGRGITVDEALKRLELIPILATAVQNVESAARDRYAGGWVDDDPEVAVFVRFTGDETGLEVQLAALAALAAPVHIEYGAAHTYSELRSAQQRITTTVYQDYPRTGMYVDVRTGSVTLLGPDPISATELDALSRLADSPVRHEWSPAFENVHTYGGKNIEDKLACTTGFSVFDAITHEDGVLTAGHCADNIGNATYHQDANINYPMSLRGKRDDANQDFAWFSEPNHLVDNRAWDGLFLREITSTKPRLQMPNNVVCHFGRGSGYSCGVVDSIHYDPGAVCNGACDDVWGLIWNDPGLKCWGGDSGGPFMFNNAAWGIAKSAALGGNPADVMEWSS